MAHVKADATPFLLIHGTADGTVPAKHSDQFVKTLKEAGADDVTCCLRIEGSDHGAFNQHREQTAPAMAAFFEQTRATP